MTRAAVPGLFGAGLLLALLPAAEGAEAAPDVVTSIKPVHSLVSGVMAGVGEPKLIVRGGGSPHTFSLRPSDAAAIADADLVFWIGPDLETFLEAPLRKLAPDARRVALSEAPGVRLLPVREGGIWAAHGHDDEHAHGHGHADHARDEGENGHRDDHDHGHDGDRDDRHGDHHDDHGHHEDHERASAGQGEAAGSMDMHLWLDPANARAMTAAIAAALAEADPGHAPTYLANAGAMAARLDALTAEMRESLAPVADRPFVLFHDAFQYLEAPFGLAAVGSVTVSPDRQPGAERLSELRRTIRDRGAVCIFAEPQFEPRLLDVVAEGSGLRSGVLDPLGADLPDGPELYFDLMRRNARSLADCLSDRG